MSIAFSSARTQNYLQQLKGAFGYRLVAMAASYLAVPLMIRYVGQEPFGVWSTLLTVMSWIVFFDLGVGNGLRNKVAELLAKGEIAEAREFISSGYTLIGLIAAGLLLLLLPVSYAVSWQRVFNTEIIEEATLRSTVQIAAVFIVGNFWIGLIATLLGAVQQTSWISLGQLIANLSSLGLVFLLSWTGLSSIQYLALAYGFSLVLANIVLSIRFYRTYPGLRPRAHLDKVHVQPLLKVGLQFFAIQVAGLILFSTDKMLITQLFGPGLVTPYEVVFRLFSVFTLLHTLISVPLWSAYTDAFHRGDMAWIQKTLRQQLLVFAGIVCMVLLLIGIARPILVLWVGKEVVVPAGLLPAMGVFIAVSAWNNVFAMLVNGIGEIRLQLYTALAAMCINIPLSVGLAKYAGLGVPGIVLGTSCSLLLAAVALPLQTRSFLRRTPQPTQP